MAQASFGTSMQFPNLATHAALAASVDGAEIDLLRCGQVAAFVKLGTTSGTSATAFVKLQHTDTSGSGYADVANSSTATQSLDAGAGTGKTFCVQFGGVTKRYVRYRIVLAGTTPVCGDVITCVLTQTNVSTTGAGADKTATAG